MSRVIPFLLAFLAVAAATFLGLNSRSLQFREISADAVAATFYLLIIVVVSTRYGLYAAIFTALLTCVAWSWFFVPPLGTVAVSLPDAFPLAVFIAIAIGTAVLTSALRNQMVEAEQREHEMSLLYRLTMAVLSFAHLEDSLKDLAENVADICEGTRCGFVVRHADGEPDTVVGDLTLDAAHVARMRQALENGEPLYFPTDPQRPAAYLPMRVGQDTLGIMILEAQPGMGFSFSEQGTLLMTVANHGALALQRSRLEHAAGEALGKLEAGRLKESLLASVSHDLRTPLASIKAAATSIVMEDMAADETTRDALLQSIISNADRLDRLVGNLLSMSRLEAGAWKPDKELFPFSEILATILGRLTPAEAMRVTIDMAADMPMVPLDGQQIEQVLWNLIENAMKYSPPGSALVLTVAVRDAELHVSLRDHGSGIPTGEESNIFQKFYRAHRGGERGAPGVGMGLAICKEIVEAHGGRIRAENATDGGAVFTFILPLAETEQLAHVN